MIDNKYVGKKFIVRANVAGVHAGILESISEDKKVVVLKNAVRLWRVYTRDTTGSISDIAAHGLKLPLDQHNIGAVLSTVVIVNEGFELAECTDEAFDSLMKAAPKVKK